MGRQRFTPFAWGVLAYNLAVIAWGAVVRATGSGAGCGRHWPLCNGEVVPRSPSTATLIEFSHRATSGLALVLVVVLLVWARRVFERSHPARLAAVGSMVFMLSEAGVGAGLVLFELVADNESMARALFMGTHLGNTFFLLASLVLTAWWSAAPARLGRGVLRSQAGFAVLLAVALLGTLLIGASGAVAALGDTLFPASSLEEALTKDLSPTSHFLIQLRVYHPLIAVGVSAHLLFVASLVRQRSRGAAGRLGTAVLVLVFVQLAAGGINFLLLAPVWMQVVHLLLADILWMAVVLLTATSLLPEASP